MTGDAARWIAFLYAAEPRWRASRRAMLGAAILGVGLLAALPGHAANAEAAAAPVPREYITRHSGQFNGQTVRYTATVGETVLSNTRGQPTASVFTFSYLQDGVAPERRPVIFAFNGGPGASSTSLHMAALGPYRVVMTEHTPLSNAGPYSIIPNAQCPLDVADIVLIDPVETGFSRILPAGNPADYLGVEQDAAEMDQVIRDWLTRHQRWNSPKFILGESYGSIRVPVLVRSLMGSVAMGSFHGVAVNGIMLYAVAVDRASSEQQPGNDLLYQHLLPTMAATAWYHDKVDKAGRTYDQFMQAAKEFAASDYAGALYRGSELPQEERHRIARQLSQLIGLDAQIIEQNNLRITASVFAHKLLEKEGLVVGLYDSRYVSPTVTGADFVGDDPGVAQQSPFIVAALHEHLSKNLHVPDLGEYIYINFKLEDHWDWSTHDQHGEVFYRTYAGLLGAALRQNPGLEALIGSGKYDLITPMGGAQHMANHSGMPMQRVRMETYDSGHKPYVGEDSLRQFADGIRHFVRGSPKP